jgi:hypothetical protein
MGHQINMPMWQAVDGKTFLTQAEMLEYEGSSMFDALIDQYVREVNLTEGLPERSAKAAVTRTRTVMRSALAYFDTKGYLSPSAKQAAETAASTPVTQAA